MDESRVIAQRYRLGRKLGEGGMGSVYEARHVVTGRRFAVKVLERRDSWPAEAVARFVREAQAPAEIAHPHLVDIFDAGQEPDGTPYLVMELLEGETLADLLRRERVLQPGALGPLFDALLSALEAMHARGFVHRDLKPANVFLSHAPSASATGSNPGVGAAAPSGTNEVGATRVKLLDLGIAKALGEDGSTRSGYVIGTPAYMAPEQMRSAKSATPRSDLWSVGVMLYECLVGHRPFRGETFGLLAQISGPGPAPSLAQLAPDLPTALTGLVDALLQKDPARRPANANEVRERLASALVGCPRVEPIDPVDGPDDAAPAPSHPSQSAPGLSATLPGDAGASSLHTSPGTRVSRRIAITLAGAIALCAVVLLASWKPRTLVNHPARPSASASTNTHGEPGAVRAHPELGPLLDRWAATISAAQGRGPMGDFYADQVKFRGSDALATPAAIARYWPQFYRAGNSFSVDLSRATVLERAPDLNEGVSAACVNLEGAQGRVFEVRAHATEVVTDRSPDIGCARLEGVYLLRLRRTQGQLRICHETWSLREGVCASCPSAPVCRAGTR